MQKDQVTKLKEENDYLKKRIEEIEQQAMIGLWKFDHKKNVLSWDNSVHKIFGVPVNDFSGDLSAFLDRVHPDDREEVETAFTNSLKLKQPYQIDHRLLLDDKSIKYVHEWCRTDFAESGEPLVSYGTVQDISETKKMEDEKKSINKQIYQFSQMAALGELASGIAHEINNPLAILKGYHDLKVKRLEYCSDPERLRDILQGYVEGERNALHRLDQVIHSLKSYNFKDNLDMSLFSIGSEVRSSVDFIKSIYENDGILVSFQCCAEEVYVEGYPNYFQQILMNLYSNAKDALRDTEDAHISIRCSTENGKVIVEVSDNGPGIPANIIDKIFDFRFTTKSVGKGTGFGLHLAQEFITKMNGKVTVRSTEGKGATFVLELPIHHMENATESVESFSQGKLYSLDHKYKMLVVDDEEDIAEYLATLLEFEGHEVDYVTSGKEALEKIAQNKYDAVFTDIVMPEMNGQALLRRLTQMKFEGKRVIVSGNFFPQAKSAVMRYDEVMDKPFTKNDLLRVLHNLFGES